MKERTIRGLVAVAVLSSLVTSAGAQDPRGGNKPDVPSRVAIAAIVDSARVQGIPVGPLWEKLDEGMAKGIDGPRIVVAVRALYGDMLSAQRALGPLATADEIKAAAFAVHAGVPAVELGKIKKQNRLRSLASPFIALSDIVSRGVPVGTAVNAIRSMVGAGAKDKDINDFQRSVKDDIDKGAPPAASAETRAKGTAPAAKPEMDQDKLDR